VLRLWILPLTGSLWLDETVTYWVAYKGLAAALRRSQFFPGQPAVYTAIAALAIRVGGPSEIVLRLPSLIAAGLTAWLLYRLGKVWLDREAGIIVAIVFTSLHEIAREAAVNARPYAFGLLLVVGGMLELVRWLQSGRVQNLLTFVALSAAIVYFHYLFGVVYLVFLVYCFYVRWSGETPVPWKSLLTAWGLIAVLISPLLWNAVYAKRVSAGASFAPSPSIFQLFSSFLPPLLGASLFVGVLVAVFVCGECRATLTAASRSIWLLLMGWAAVPTIVLYLIARLTPFKTFVPRYFLETVPALSLLVGWLVRGLQPARARIIVATTIAAISIVSIRGGLRHPMAPLFPEDWRAAAASVRAADIPESTPVLVRTGLIETAKIRWGLDIDRDSPLLAPTSKYPIPGRIILLPYNLNPEAENYLQDVYYQVLRPTDTFVLIARNYGSENVIPWLRGWLCSKGFQASEMADTEGVTVLLFRRTPAGGRPSP
jgi:hypothetical protein